MWPPTQYSPTDWNGTNSVRSCVDTCCVRGTAWNCAVLLADLIIYSVLCFLVVIAVLLHELSDHLVKRINPHIVLEFLYSLFRARMHGEWFVCHGIAPNNLNGFHNQNSFELFHCL